MGQNCASDPNFFWTDFSDVRIYDCNDNECFNPQTQSPQSYLEINNEGSLFQFNIPENLLFADIGFDITYYSNNPRVIFQFSAVQLDTGLDPNYVNEFDSQLVDCSAIGQTQLMKTELFISGLYIQSGVLVIQKSESTQILGIRSIRVWINCSSNCKECLSQFQCAKCFDTYDMHTEVISGESINSCETIEDCPSGCAQCYQEQSQTLCSICQAGFTFNQSTKLCVANIFQGSKPCSPIQYIDSKGSCKNYSSLSFYQDKSGTGWVQFIIDDPLKYHCNEGQLILKYDYYNYELFRCGCTVRGCSKCNQIDSCFECKEGQYVAQNSLECIQCSVNNCSDCQASNGTSCTLCKIGFLFNPLSNLCLPPCGLDEYRIRWEIACKVCDSGRFIDNDGNCVCTNSNQTYDQKLGFCVSDNGITGELKDKVSIGGYNLSVDFDVDLLVYAGQNIISVLSIQISHGNRTEFSFQVKEIKGKSISVEMIPQINFKEELITLTLIDPVFISQNNIKSAKYEQTLKTFIFYNEEQKSAIQATSSIGEVTVMTIIGTIIPIAIFSNFYVIINTIDLTAFLYYLLFIDVRYPENVLSFFEFFQNFQFPFIPSMFESIISPDYVQDAPQKFIDNEFQPYFLSNSGQSITIVLFILVLYVIGKAFSYVKIPKVQPYLKRAMNETWEYSAFFDLLWSLYIYFLIGSLLQFMVYDSGEENYIMNYILHSIFAIIHIGCPFLITYFIFKQKNLKSDKVFRMKYSTLVGGLELYDEQEMKSEAIPNQSIDLINMSKEFPQSNLVSERNVAIPEQLQPEDQEEQLNEGKQNQEAEQPQEREQEQKMFTKRKFYQVKLSKMYNPFLYLRKLLYSIVIVFLTQFPYTQLILITILNMIIGLYILYIMPLDNTKENFKNATGEIILIIIQICVAFLVSDEKEEDENNRIKIGWIIVGLSAFIMQWHTLQLLLETITSLVKAVKSLFAEKKKSEDTKVHAIEQHEIKMIEKQLEPETADKTCQQQSIRSPSQKQLSQIAENNRVDVVANPLETQKQFTQTELDGSSLMTQTVKFAASQRNSQVSIRKLSQHAIYDYLKQQ